MKRAGRMRPGPALASLALFTIGLGFLADGSAAVGRIHLPDGPEKRLLEQHCRACHDLSRVESAGGSRSGWSSRLKRMIRRGSTLPPQDVAALAGYLSRTLPERLKAPAPDSEQSSQ